jgi:hypothetical protein
MRKRYHIPARLRWKTEPTTEENARLHRAITAAIRRSVEGLTGETPEIVVVDFEAPTRERFSMGRYRPDRDTYAVPSYQNHGEPTEAPVEEITFEETPVITGALDQVTEGQRNR